jgi:hypothetical protein
MSDEGVLRDDAGDAMIDPAVVGRHERIARRAFDLYTSRGEPGTGALQDWLQAEAEIEREDSAPA